MQRSFYYWKTVVRLSPKEKETLKHLGVSQLYVKLFDVVWDEESGSTKPVAKSLFPEQLPTTLAVTPVVFITQEPLQRLAKNDIDSLAKNIATLLAQTASTNKLTLTNEVQLDCDWTAGTKDAYFYLLQQVKQQAFFRRKTVSATIRLHQLKFISQNGVPPVDKGLLMCYNMGNLRQAQTRNSILDETELRKYINNLKTYPLPLDVALPVFDWWVLFEGDRYKGLLREFEPGEVWEKKKHIEFAADTVVNGYAFKSGQWLRHEAADAKDVQRCANLVSERLATTKLTVILYHLNQEDLNKYTLHELESFYNGLR